MIILPELTIEELKRNNKKYSSYSYTLLLKKEIKDLEKEIYIDTLKNIFDNLKILEIKDTLKKSLQNFFEKHQIKYGKTTSTINLIDKLIKYNQNNKIKLAIIIDNFSPKRKETEYIEHMLRNLSYQNAYYHINDNYPILITHLNLYKNLNESNSLWRYKPVKFFKANISIEVAIWINKYECYKCKSNTNIIVGIVLKYKDKIRIIQLNELNNNFFEFINKYFSCKNDKKSNININYVSFKKEICNFCLNCNALIGNFHIFDDFIVESMPFWDEAEFYKKFKYIKVPYKDIKKCFYNKELSWVS